MADGGKPLAEAKIKLSVEGGEQVRAELEGISQAAKSGVQDVSAWVKEHEKFDQVNRELVESIHAEQQAIHDAGVAAEVAEQRVEGLRIEQERMTETLHELSEAEKVSATNLQSHATAATAASVPVSGLNARFVAMNESIKGVVGGGLRLISTITRIGAVAGAAVGAVAALALSIKRLGDEVNGTATKKGFHDAEDFIRNSGIEAARTERDIDGMTKGIESLNDELAALNKQSRESILNNRSEAAINKLSKEWRQLQIDIAEATREQEKWNASQARMSDGLKAGEEAYKRINDLATSTITEEEKARKDLARFYDDVLVAIEAGRVITREEYQRAEKALKDRIAAIVAEKNAKKDAIVEESRAAIEADRQRAEKDRQERSKTIRDAERAGIASQQRVFDEGRREAERSLSSIAVTSANAAQLLRTISASRGGSPWQ